jgi:hypothetical protein
MMTSDFVLPAGGFAGAGFGGCDSETNPSRPSSGSVRIATTLDPAAPSALLSSLVPDGHRFGFVILDIEVLGCCCNATPCQNDSLEIAPNRDSKTSIKQTFVCEVNEQIDRECGDSSAKVEAHALHFGSACTVSA